jgi:hypothetical protein
MHRRRGHGGIQNYQSYPSSQPSTSSSAYSSPTLAEDEYAESSSGPQPRPRPSGRGRAANYTSGQYESTGPSSASSTPAGPAFSTFRVTGYQQQEQPIAYPPGPAVHGSAYAQAGSSGDPFPQTQSCSYGDPRETTRERRRQQNKLAQRALRQRKETRLRELESRIINARLTTRSLESENQQLETQLQNVTSQNRALRHSMGLGHPPASYSSFAGPSTVPLAFATQHQPEEEDHEQVEGFDARQHLPDQATFVSGQRVQMQGRQSTYAPDLTPQSWSMSEFLDPAVWDPTQYGFGQQTIPQQPLWYEEEEGAEGGDDEEEDEEVDEFDPQEGYLTCIPAGNSSQGTSSRSVRRPSPRHVQRWLYDPSQTYGGEAGY